MRNCLAVFGVLLIALMCNSCKSSFSIITDDPHPENTIILTAAPVVPSFELKQQEAKENVIIVDAITTDNYACENPEGEDYTEFCVELSNNTLLTQRFDGEYISTLYRCDFDKNTFTEEFIIYLDYYGSSYYGQGEVHIMSLVDSELTEMPLTIVNPLNLDIPCEGTLNDDEECMCKAYPIEVDGINMLRAEYVLFDTYGDDRQYIDVLFKDDHWEIVNSGVILDTIWEE